MFLITDVLPLHQELALLDGSNVVFKLLGPVLVKQELGEASSHSGEKAGLHHS